MKRIKIYYWICTAMLIPAFGIGSIFEIVPNEDTLQFFATLGYPEYIIPFLSIAKLLGLIVILIPKFPRLKEWAYAGIAFDVIGAIYSIIAMNNPLNHIIFPVIALLFLFGSYYFHHQKMSFKN